LYFLGMVEDITERKQTGAALRETEELFRQVFEQGPLGIAIIGLDYREVAVNATLCKMVGYTEEELTNVNCGDLTHPDDIEPDLEYVKKLSRGEIPFYKMEKRYIKKNGEVLWVHLTVSVIRDDQGKALYFLSLIEDITERKRAEVSLRESEERMSLIIDSSPVGIAIAQDGKYIYVNPALTRMFGYESQDEIVGLTAETLFAPASRETIRQRTAARMADKAIPAHFESVGMTKNGKRFEVEGWGTAIKYPGKRSALAFIIDVSEARSLRAQLIQAQKMEAIGNLAGGIAHDFNNLLTVILGYTELIICGKDEGDRDYEDLKKVIQAAGTAAEIVHQILAFSRRTESEPQPIDLNQQVEQLRKMLSRLIPKTIQVRINLGPDLPVLNADPSQMVQVLMNLAVNARDAMPEGGRLTIETQTTLLDDDYCHSHIEASQGLHAVLMVSDTGIGMDKALMDRIFEPFYTTKKPGEGTGLGLAMVYGIVKSHGGHITCYSEPGAGTTFKIYLPVHQADAELDAPTSRESSACVTGTILLVDDEEFVRSLGERILENSGCNVITADNGREAVEIYRQNKDEISLVILDLIMPMMDGKKCLDEILRIDPAAKVLIASGFSPDRATKEILEGGAKGFVGKPYNLKQLLGAVRHALNEE
ncbi:MAG: PAS domain S-box protein, partial [Desulfomonilaceae bacterium]